MSEPEDTDPWCQEDDGAYEPPPTPGQHGYTVLDYRPGAEPEEH